MSKFNVVHFNLVRNEVTRVFIRFVNDTSVLTECLHHQFVIWDEDEEKFAKFGSELQNVEICSINNSLSFSNLSRLLSIVRGADCVVMHSLLPVKYLLVLSGFKIDYKKFIWMVFGGDAYQLQRTPRVELFKSVEWIRRMIRRFVVRKVALVISNSGQELKRINVVTGTRAKLGIARYPLLLHSQQLEVLSNKRKSSLRGFSSILLGNSACPSNGHIELLDGLSDIMRSCPDLTILCPLSYSGPADYVNAVIAHGRELFGERFNPLIDYLPLEEYLKLISFCSFAVMNHTRQRGLGVINVLLYIRVPVYMNESNLSARSYGEIGVKVYSTNRLLESGLQHIGDENVLDQNHKKIKHIWSEERIAEEWSNQINGVLSTMYK